MTNYTCSLHVQRFYFCFYQSIPRKFNYRKCFVSLLFPMVNLLLYFLGQMYFIIHGRTYHPVHVSIYSILNSRSSDLNNPLCIKLFLFQNECFLCINVTAMFKWILISKNNFSWTPCKSFIFDKRIKVCLLFWKIW